MVISAYIGFVCFTYIQKWAFLSKLNPLQCEYYWLYQYTSVQRIYCRNFKVIFWSSLACLWSFSSASYPGHCMGRGKMAWVCRLVIHTSAGYYLVQNQIIYYPVAPQYKAILEVCCRLYCYECTAQVTMPTANDIFSDDFIIRTITRHSAQLVVPDTDSCVTCSTDMDSHVTCSNKYSFL